MRLWSAQDEVMLREYIATRPHWTALDIAGVFGVSRSAIMGKLRRMGLSLVAGGRGEHPDRLEAISARISAAHAKRRRRCPACKRILPR